MNTVDDTNNPTLESWVDTKEDSQFPIQNIPFGVCRPKSGGVPRVCTAIGEYILDLSVLENAKLLPTQEIFNQPTLNAFMELGRQVWTEVRVAISTLLRKDEPTLRDNESLRKQALIPLIEVDMLLPVDIGDYTDFYSSKEHATNVGIMFRGKDNALNPNWLHLPVAYHGRSSSIVVSETPIHRPQGQTKADDQDLPSFGPSKLLDFELEMGLFIGTGNPLGQPIPVDQAKDHIFGLCLVNDWSARDIQKWEYVPLGPFLAKNFATTLSPWVITLDALKPFRCEGPEQEPQPLPYLQTKGPTTYDIQLEAFIKTPNMDAPERICTTNFKYLYWNMQQQIAHHTVTGCNLKAGDLMASGTISGATEDSRGSLLELSWRGQTPLEFSNGETRKFLQDGDELVIRGYCQGPGYRIGFGECRGRVEPCVELSRRGVESRTVSV